MNAPGSSKVVERAIKDYHAKIAEYDAAKIVHELGRRGAFQGLLENTAKPMAGWQVISESPVVIHKGKSIRPDGLLRDEYGLRRGFWEAKDKADDLDKEIRAKIAAGYPTENIIFEDTHTAILFQDGKRLPAFDLKNPVDVRHLLDTFYKHTAKVIEEFNQAIAQPLRVRQVCYFPFGTLRDDLALDVAVGDKNACPQATGDQHEID